MNKKIFWTTLLLFSLTLTSCASIARTTGTAPSGSPSATELPAQTKLILGIIKLDETENAVTGEQAKELLPMFHVLQALNESDTAAQEEIDGLTHQIQETLTDEQAQAITSMSLSMQDMMSMMRGNSGGTNNSMSSSTSGGGGGAGGPPEMGGMPAGGMGGPQEMGGMSGGGNQPTSTSENETKTARPASLGTPTALFDAVIKLLEKKVQPQ